MSLPIILMMMKNDDQIQMDLATIPFMVLLEKPFDRIELTSSVRTILSVEQSPDDQILRTSLDGDPEIGPLITEFVQRILESIERVAHACRRGPVSTIAYEIRKIAEDSIIVGYFLLGEMLMQTWNSIGQSENVGDARAHVEEVLPLLRRLHGLNCR